MNNIYLAVRSNSVETTTKQMSSEHEGLMRSEAALSRATPVVAHDSEKAALKEFCLLNLKRRSLLGSSEDKAKGRETIKASKAALEAFMTNNEFTCCCLSKAQFELAIKDYPEVPPLYVRLVRSNKDATITPEIVEEAIDSVTSEDIREFGSIVEAIIHHVRNTIRSYKTSLSLSDSRERNQHIYDTPTLPDDMFNHVLAWHGATLAMTEAHKKHKEALAELTAAIGSVKPVVESFFERTGLITQRVTMEDSPYRITRKVSVRNVRIGIPKLQSLLTGINTENLHEIKTGIRQALQNVPPTTKADIVFCAVKH